MKTDLFQFCGCSWVFQICWHIECSTFTASSFRTWNSSAGIPSPPLALFIVMLPKAHLAPHSRMFGSRWVITPSWLPGSLRSFLYSTSVYSCHLFLTFVASVRSIPFLSFIVPICFPDSSVGKELACNAGDPGLIPGSGRSTGEEIGYPLQYSWASLVAKLVKNTPAVRETWVRSLGWEDPLEKGKATHSSILAWRIPWTVQSMRSQRVRHDWVTFTFTFAWNVPLVSLVFLKRKFKSFPSLVFPILLFPSISLHWSLRKAFLSLLAILWNSAFRWVYIFFSIEF